MARIRIVAEVEDDIFDELCSYNRERVNIMYCEEADEISWDKSGIVIKDEEMLQKGATK